MGSSVTAPYFDSCMREMLTAGDIYQKGVEMVYDDHNGHSDHIMGPSGGNSHYVMLAGVLSEVVFPIQGVSD